MPALWILGAALAAASPEADLYVSPSGNDTWSGRLHAPNAGGSDGPVASLARARDLAAELKAAQASPKPVVVDIRGGDYFLTEPFRLGPAHSGGKDAPIVYAARPGERPVFSGGRVIGGWEKGDGPLWKTAIPEVKAGNWYFHQLFVNGERRVRARTPNEGYLRATGPLQEYKKDKQDPSFKDEAVRLGCKFHPGDLRAAWRNPGDINLFLYHSWTTSMHWIDRMDEAAGAVHFTNKSAWPAGYWEREQRYHVENVRECLDAPGEWYLDRATGVLEYYPLSGEDMASAEVIAPLLGQLVVVEGDPAAGRTVHDVEFHGLCFRHADWTFPDKKQTVDGQSFIFLPGALQARGAERMVLADCEIAHLGGYAIALEDGCKSNRIERCHLHDLGGGGIRIGEFVRQKTRAKSAAEGGPAVPELAPDGSGARDTARNTVDNCFIHAGGRVFTAGAGVIIGHSAFNEVTHNEICDFLYTSVSVGWVWGFGQSAAHHNLIAHNHLHHLGWGVLSDMGGVYTLGPSPGTEIRHNHIHHVNCYDYGGWGLYTDEGSSDILLEDNIVHDTRDGSFHQHYGRNNTVRNNLLTFSRGTQIRRSREDLPNHLTFERNIVYGDNDDMLSRVWKNGDYAVNHNLYWTTSTHPPLFDDREWDEWRATSGQDKDSLLADPLFVDSGSRDFRLRPGSPAAKIGFQTIDPSGIGLYGDPAWVALPAAVRRPEFNLPPSRNAALYGIAEGFEETATGEKAANATTNDGGAGASIRVAEDGAASGKHSLKFTDASGLRAAFFPYLEYKPRLTGGVARGSFDVCMETGAVLLFEWRDAATPYRTGPWLRIEADGAVTVNGKRLTTVAPGKWSRFEIVCGLGDQSTGTWDLAITPAGGTPQKFKDLPLRSTEFRRLQWLGFVCPADAPGVFHIDNVDLGPAVAAGE